VTGARCLYCGAELKEEALQKSTPLPTLQDPLPPDKRASDRMLLILEISREDPPSLARALGISLFEADLRVRRGGFQLHRIAPAREIRNEATRLGEAGLSVVTLDEDEVRAAALPELALRGQMSEGTLALRTEASDRLVAREDLLIVVRGPIAKEHQAQPPSRVRPSAVTFDPGYRIHLHTRALIRPVELDPESFAFSCSPIAGSSLLELNSWLSAFSAPVDDGFRFLPPALSPAGEAEGVTAAVQALKDSPTAGRRKEQSSPVLDNVGQFRFYSAWRGTLERRRL